jgi:hypothetical protein
MNNEFATKSDITLVRADIALGLSRLERHEELTKAEFAAVRGEMKTEFAAVRGEMNAQFAAVRGEMNATETRLVIKLGGLMITLIGAVSAISNWLN